MKRSLFLSVFLLYGIVLLCAQGPHPLKNEICVYLEKINIDNRLDKVLAGIKKESMEYNKQGYFAYEKRDWDKALRQFNKAIEIDDKNSFAHYNYACTLSLKYGSSAGSKALDEIVAHLETAAELDVYWCIKIFDDTDFDAIRKMNSLHNEHGIGGDCAMETYVSYNDDGSVNINYGWDNSGMGPAGPEVQPREQPVIPKKEIYYRGFYCIIGNSIIAFFPEIRNKWSFSPDMPVKKNAYIICKIGELNQIGGITINE
jgi:hypothetical protein